MISHLLSAFAHICLSAAGIIAFITAGNLMDSPAANLTPVAVRVGGVTIHPWAGTSWYSSIPEANATLPWGGSAIVSPLLRDVRSNSFLILLSSFKY